MKNVAIVAVVIGFVPFCVVVQSSVVFIKLFSLMSAHGKPQS